MNTNKTSLKIIVGDRGFVWIGFCRFVPAGVEPFAVAGLVMEQGGYNIREWGTTRGLGQLATCGPTVDTHLDDARAVFMPAHSVLFVMDVDATQWLGFFPPEPPTPSIP